MTSTDNNRTKNVRDKRLPFTPYIGTKDFYGQDFKVQAFIFDTWRKVVAGFGYQEYILPIVENAELFIKSGDDLGNKELYDFIDKGGRKIAIRPEATPGVTRMVAKFYRQTPKPIRVFSVMNFMRYERPQAGRMREFWQLNVDMFGKDNVFADAEILSIVVNIMYALGAPKRSFKTLVNSRKFFDALLSEATPEIGSNEKSKLYRIVDKATKLSPGELYEMLKELDIPEKARQFFANIKNIGLADILANYPDLKQNAEFKRLQSLLNLLPYPEVQFAPYIVRGLDYYDGMVFELFEATGKITRALAGGGRYNSMGPAFGINDMPAVGFGMGNYTLADFVNLYGLLPENFGERVKVYLPILVGNNGGNDASGNSSNLDQKAYSILLQIAGNLDRIMNKVLNVMPDNQKIQTEGVENTQKQVQLSLEELGINIGESTQSQFARFGESQGEVISFSFKFATILGTEPESITKALRTANKIGAKYVIILGEDELLKGIVQVRRL